MNNFAAPPVSTVVEIVHPGEIVPLLCPTPGSKFRWYTCVRNGTQGAIMETVKVGMREFRDKLASYLSGIGISCGHHSARRYGRLLHSRPAQTERGRQGSPSRGLDSLAGDPGRRGNLRGRRRDRLQTVAGQADSMTDQRCLVLDANILLQAVFGVRVRALLEAYEDFVSFHAPVLRRSGLLKLIICSSTDSA